MIGNDYLMNSLRYFYTEIEYFIMIKYSSWMIKLTDTRTPLPLQIPTTTTTTMSQQIDLLLKINEANVHYLKNDNRDAYH